VICYGVTGAALRAADALEVLQLADIDAQVAAGQMAMQLFLEIDLGTESSEQLERRAARWGAALRAQRAHLETRCWPYVVWVTDGGWERAQTIWRAWLRKAALPLFVTTSSALRIADRWRPWHAVWRDEHGRPRTLNPFGGQEPLWRFQASPAPSSLSLEQAIAAWEATQRV
jgi:hypothetical protein